MKMTEICPLMNCCGCEACVNACPRKCISFVTDKEGFNFPQIDAANCVDCKLCQKVCPANSSPKYNAAQTKVYAAWALDDKIRQSSSSGGLYSIFANYCFSQGGVANGVVFNDELLVVHKLCDKTEDTIPCRGSKYVQSRPGNIYREVKNALEAGKMVFFTSNPCQVDALYKFLGKDYDNLYTCDFICHGTPSPEYLKDSVNKITHGADSIDKITFRDLSFWGNFKIRVECGDKKYSEDTILNSYTKTFLSGSNYRYSCYGCRFARAERVADITIGDFWGVGKYMPFLHDTSKGVSLVMLNTEKGRYLFEQIKDQIFFAPRAFREAARENHQLKHNVSMQEHRGEFYTDVQNMSSADIIKKYHKPLPLVKKLLSLPLRVCHKIVKICIKVLKIS